MVLMFLCFTFLARIHTKHTYIYIYVIWLYILYVYVLCMYYYIPFFITRSKYLLLIEYQIHILVPFFINNILENHFILIKKTLIILLQIHSVPLCEFARVDLCCFATIQNAEIKNSCIWVSILLELYIQIVYC